MSKKYNKSRTYILPLIASRHNIIMQYVTNTYLYTIDYFDKFNIVLECIFNDITEVESFDKEINIKHSNIRKFIISEKNVIKCLYIIKLDKDFENAYNCFIAGKYSKITNVDKNIIMSFWTKLYKDTQRPFLLKLKRIFDRSDILKKELEEQLKVTLPEEAELSSIIDVGDEIYYGD